MLITNNNLEKIRQSPTVAMADKVHSLKSQGIPVIGLQTGDPDFGTHPAITQVALSMINAGKTHYGPSQGFIHVRKVISEKLKRDNGLEYDPQSEIIVTHGGVHAFYIALQSIINPGDEFIIPDPTWATHANMATLLGGKAVRVNAPAENGFLPSLESWQAAISEKTRGIIINYPSNPTGMYPNADYLAGLVELCVHHNLVIISDEVYENLYYEEHPVSIASLPNARERTLVINSLSKTYAMTGWRVGYLCGPKELIQNALKASQHSITCVAPFIQEAAGFALGDTEMQQFAASMRSKYAERRDLVLRIAKGNPCAKMIVTAPKGAFYYFLDLRKVGMDDNLICDKLLMDAQVGTVAGSAFGTMGQGFIRMTIAASNEEITVGFGRMIEWVNQQ